MNNPPKQSQLLPPIWVLVLGIVSLLLWVTIQLKEIFVLLVVGFSIAYTIEPALQWLEEKKISRGVGIFVLLFALIAAILVLIITAIPTVIREYHDLAVNLPGYVQTAKEKALPYLEKLEGIAPIHDIISHPLDTLSAYGSTILKKVFTTASAALLKGYSITLTLVNLTLLPFIVYYLSMDFPQLFPKITQFIPPSRKDKFLELAGEINSYVSAFVRGQIAICTILFLCYAIGLWSIGLELWLLLAVIAGYGNLIPYLGFAAGIVLASIMALVTFGDLTHLLLTWGVFGLVQFLEGTFITPKIMGQSVGLSPLTVILAIVAGGSLFGLLGVFLAIPGAAILRVVALHLHEWLVMVEEGERC